MLRSRDHSHVELLLREGLITAEQAQTHPMRNFVECCLGGDPIVPDMTLTRRRVLEPNDVLLVCTDGFWAGVKDGEIASEVSAPGVALKEKLLELAQRAVMRNGRRERQHVRSRTQMDRLAALAPALDRLSCKSLSRQTSALDRFAARGNSRDPSTKYSKGTSTMGRPSGRAPR